MTQFKEIPASQSSLSRRKPLYGVGINDADYIVQPTINGKRLMCPYYKVWDNMLKRCYSNSYQKNKPTYAKCSVSVLWLTFSGFKQWMEKQDWKSKQLDKDLLISGNKIYSPEACIFVSSQLNSLLLDRCADRGEFPQGVILHKGTGKYQATCSIKGRLTYLGLFQTAKEAEIAYLLTKAKTIRLMACGEECLSNQRLKNALTKHINLLESRASKL